MSTAKDRVILELQGLQERLAKLNEFLESPTITGEPLELLIEQSIIMMQYVRILKRRLEIWN